MGKYSDLTAGLDTLPQQPMSRYAQLLPDEERGFFDNIAEAWKRGDQQIQSDIAVYEALQSGEGLQRTLNARKQYQAKEVVDPVEGNFLSNLVYKSAKVLPGWLSSSKDAVKETLIGAGIGAGVAAIAGQLGPQAALPEEIITVPGGAIKGAKWGYTIGSAHFWYKQGAGSMYADMVEQGFDPEVSEKIAKIAAVPYAALEFLQFKSAVAPAFRKIVTEGVGKNAAREFAKKFGKEYLKTLGKEVTEEVAQEMVQIVAEDIAAKASGFGIDINKDYFVQRSQRLAQTAWQSLQAFTLIPVPGTAIQAGRFAAASSAKGQPLFTGDHPIAREFTGEVYSEESVIGAESTGGFGPRELTYPVDYRVTLQKMGRLVGQAKPILKTQEELYRKEHGKRGSELENILKSGDSAELKQIAKKAIAGEYDKAIFEPIAEQFSAEELETVRHELRNSSVLLPFERLRAEDAIDNLLVGQLPNKSSLSLIEKQFGKNALGLTQALMGKIPQSSWNKILEAINLPRTLLASCDLSAPLRQGAVFAAAHPKQWLSSTWAGYKILFSPNSLEHAEFYDKQIETNPLYLPARAAGLELTEWRGMGRSFGEREEQFMSTYAEQLPLVGKLVKRSERAYVVGLNKLRMDVFSLLMEQLDAPTKTDMKYIADMINYFTGRGKIPKQETFGPIANALAFSPKFLMSRIQTFQMLGQSLVSKDMSFAVRKIVWADMAKFIGAGMTILGLAALAGNDVESDPRSSDFGKIQMGGMRIDIWAGYSPLIRAVIQLGLGEKKSINTGRVYEVKSLPDRWEYILKPWLRGKLNPVASFAADVVTGESITGEDVVLTDPAAVMERAIGMLVPLAAQDALDALRWGGFSNAMVALPLAFHGIGVQTYEPTAFKEANDIKNQIALETFGRKWDELSQIAQNLLRQARPQIELTELKAKSERTNYTFISKEAERSAQTGLDIQRALPKNVQKAMMDSMVTVGGLSRRVGTNWWLNDENYKKYSDLVTLYLNKILPAFIDSPGWSKLSAESQRLWLDKVIAFSKETARKQVINDANLKDLVSLRDMKIQG